MSITNTTSSMPAGGFAGNTVIPFSYGSCLCRTTAQRSRDLVSTQRASTLATVDRIAATLAGSKTIVWTGPAAEEFQSRLDRVRRAAAILAGDTDDTHRLAWGRHDAQ